MKAKWRKDWSKASSEDFQDAARTLRGMFRAERDRGNTGLSITLDGAAYALDRFSGIRQLERVVYDLKMILGWKMSYMDFWDAVTDKGSWDPNISPSYPNAARRLTDNVLRFISWWVFPWRRWRWRFMEFFVNRNESKLLDIAASWAYIRNREAGCRYYEMRFTGLRYKLIRTRWVDGGGSGCNTFLAALRSLVDDDDGEAAKLRKEEKAICSGWVFGAKSFVREMDKVIEATPDLGWIKS